MLSSIFSFLICVGITAAGAIWFFRRRDGTFATFLTGALCFLISQPLLRIPLIRLLGQKSDWFTLLPYTNIVLYYLIMGFTAGLFEETARFIALKFIRRGCTSWIDGIAYGLGHGGIEATWLFVMQVLPLIRQGQTGINLAIGAWERIFTILVQIGLSFLVLYGIKTHRMRWLIIAIALHTLVDFLIIIGNVWIVEGLITVEGILSLIFVIKSKKKFDMGGISL